MEAESILSIRQGGSMKRKLAVLVVLITSLTIASATVWAQATAQITGTIRDSSGAVLPGAEVKATQTETGITRTTISNETGTFVLPNLPTGPYRLEAALPGFRTFLQNNLVLQVNANPAINISLEVGQVAESVEVQANAAQVETRSTAVGGVIENQRIVELPLNGRQVTDLITLAGGAVQNGTADNKGWQSSSSAGLISIAGGQDFGVGYTLDGAMYSDVQEGNALPLPFPDALQEFKVEISGSSANSGMRSGGAVAAVTKSGTNEIHGDAFEFVRNGIFNARNFFASKRDSLKRNQYGGTIGAPLIKDKLFFFGGYQGTKVRSDPTGITSYVPTAQMLAGDFTTIASPACNNGKQITLKAPFVNNRIDASLLDKPASKVANMLLASPTSTPIDGCGTVNWGGVQKINEWQLVDKTDYQINSKQSIFFRNLFTTYTLPVPYALSGNLLSTASGGWDNLASAYAFGDTYLFGPNTVNAFRLTVNRTAAHRLGASFFGPSDIGVAAHSDPVHAMAINVNSGFIVGNGSYSDSTTRTTAYQLSDEVNVVKGNHQLAFGAIIADWRSNNYSHTSSLGAYTFDGSITGLGMADFLTGNMATFNQGTQTHWSDREAYVMVYLQDTWKITPRFTTSLGLRWEPSFPLALTQGAVYGFSLDRYQQGIVSKVFPNAPPGVYFPGDPGFPSGSRSYNPNYKQFAPRVGFAFDPKGDGKTSIRAAFGYAYDFNATQSVGGTATAPPYAFRTTVSQPKGGFDSPWSGVPGGDPFPFYFDRSKAQFQLASGFQPPLSYDMPNPRVENWNLSIQREIPSDFLFTATYIGSHTTHLWQQQAINDGVFIPGNCVAGQYGLTAPGACTQKGNVQSRRPLTLLNPQAGAYYGLVDFSDPNGSAFYHGMVLSLQRRAAKGVNIGGNYTLSHCIGDTTPFGGSFNVSANNQTYLVPNNRRYDRGNCLSDRRHIFNMTVVAATPKFSNTAMRYAASGWTVSALYRYNAGKPFNALTGTDRLLNGNTNPQRVNQILGTPYGDRSGLNYLNIPAFAQPDIGTYSNMRGYALVGPPSFGLDLALSRAFQVRESQRIEIRGEAFNLTNSLRRDPLSTNNPLYDPATFYSYNNTGTFGVIKNAQDPRIMQFALKYVF
jgi:hypothetical protein